MTKLFVLLAGILLLTGCGGSKPRPEPNVYLLRAENHAPPGPQSQPVSVGIGRVTVASYLARDGIVVATEGNRIRASRQHLWAEPLEQSIAMFLQDAISAEVGYPIEADAAKRLEWKYRIDVRIDEWHGSLDGEVRALASWVVIDVNERTELARYRFEQKAVMSNDGYDELVAVQTGLLQTLAEDIAMSIRNLN